MNDDSCICKEDGHCPRYNREMRGRLREICAGVNCDAGTSAAHRAFWLLETQKAGAVVAETKTATAVSPNDAGKKCPHLGAPVTVDGTNQKKVCEPCGGKERQLFECEHPTLKPAQVTVADCATCDYRPRSAARKLILRNHLSPGDVLVMSAAIYSLHRAHPGKFSTAVDTTANALYEHNPDVMPLEEMRANGAEEIAMHYPAVNQSNERGIHFMQGYVEFLADMLKVPIPLATNRPHVYLSKEEKTWMDQVQEATGRKQRFWIVNAGHKNDFTTKRWGTENYQRVVDSLRGKVLFVQVGSKEHQHTPLKNVLNLIGKTDLRQIVRLCWHADGVLCGVTLLQHLAAAMQKPSVVVMGGREPLTWNAYPKQHLLHTIGALPCCRNGGCWRSRVEKLGDGAEQDNSLCENPVIGEESIGKCMALIRPDEVREKILLNCS
jgi:ADP-heptose:LPS heptosyltransferase